MRRLLKQVSARLDAFVEQRDDVVLVLSAPATDALPLLSILEGVEAERGSDFFWTFTDAFRDAKSYAQAVIDAFAAKHGAVRLAMEKEGMAPWPPLPAAVAGTAAPPAQRLRELTAFSRELVPVPNGGVCVWTLFPLEVADAADYARLVRELVAHEFPFPWCHHLRFIVLDDPSVRAVERTLAQAPRVQRFAPDLGLDALNKSIEEEVGDETLPLAERMSSLLISAGNDLAFARFPAALEKFALLLKYHAAMNAYGMAALALHGMGQVYERMGDLDKANEAFLAALVPASEGEHPPIPVLQNVVLSLANLRVQQRRWEEGEGYWDVAQQLATVSRDGPLKVKALEQRGVCQAQLGKRAEAEQSWRAGSTIAAQLEDKDLCADSLERLRGLYAAQGNSAKERELREQLVQLGRSVK